jgi:glycosyltransferase involved in cell wall biosynthesis
VKPLSVLLVSTTYPRNAGDWRGRFIADMVESLSRHNDLHLAVWAPPGELPDKVASGLTGEDAFFLEGMSHAGGVAHLLRTSKIRALGKVMELLNRLGKCYRRSNHDIAHINWLQCAIPLPVNDHKPALITVLGSDYRWLSIPGVKQLLRRTLRGRRAVIAPNAEWMAPALQAAFGNLAEIRPIPFGIEHSWYDIRRSGSAAESGKWLAVTRITRGKVGDLFDWGLSAFTASRSLTLLGPHQEDSITIPSWVDYQGATSPEALRTVWFQNAAGLISLSKHDEGRPQVMLEAMASGLPIIASDLPAHRDIVQHGETGFIVSTPDELENALAYLSVSANNVRMGEAARRAALTRYGTWDDCAERYMAAYRDLMGYTR